jgi:hypothetical protein
MRSTALDLLLSIFLIINFSITPKIISISNIIPDKKSIPSASSSNQKNPFLIINSITEEIIIIAIPEKN